MKKKRDRTRQIRLWRKKSKRLMKHKWKTKLIRYTMRSNRSWYKPMSYIKAKTSKSNHQILFLRHNISKQFLSTLRKVDKGKSKPPSLRRLNNQNQETNCKLTPSKKYTKSTTQFWKSRNRMPNRLRMKLWAKEKDLGSQLLKLNSHLKLFRLNLPKKHPRYKLREEAQKEDLRPSNKSN